MCSTTDENQLLRIVRKYFNFKLCTVHFKNTTKSGDNYVGNILRVEITGTTFDNEVVGVDLIFKRIPASQLQRQFFNCEKCFAREIFMYETVLPYFTKMEINKNIAKEKRFKYAKLYGTCNEKGNEALVLQDLSALGCIVKDRTKSLDFLHCKIVMDVLAKFHSFSFALKDKNPVLFKEFTKDLRNIFVTRRRYEEYSDEYKMAFRRLEYILGQEFAPVYKEKLDKYEREFLNIAEMFDSPHILGDYGVIVHGDSWINNIFFQYKEDDYLCKEPVDIYFIDYQISSHTSPVLDIAYFIYMSTDKTLREQHMDDLFKIYYKSLGKYLLDLGSNVEKMFPYQIFEQQIKQFSSYGFFTSIILLHLFLGNRKDNFDSNEMITNPDAHNEKVMNKAISDDYYRNRIKDIFYEMCHKDFI